MATSADPTPTSRARGVRHRFGEVRALEDVDLELSRGEITALVGANGSGKTTLLRILGGILPPAGGEVWVLGHLLRAGKAHPRGRRARDLRRRTSYVSQDPALDPEMTGAEILTLLASLYGVRGAERRRRVAELAGAFGVTSHLERPVGSWSGGLRRRLHLAAGMIHDPELLLLDEPSAGLDPAGDAFLWMELERRAVQGAAVAVVSHDLAAVEEHAGTVVTLAAGRLQSVRRPATRAP